MADLAGLLGDGRLALLGCGKMGGALLEGWRAAGVPGTAIDVIEPAPTPALRERADADGIRLNPDPPPDEVRVAVIAVKPQVLDAALPQIAPLDRHGALFLSIAAGITIERLARWFPRGGVVRAMPNTPASIGRGASALTCRPELGTADRALAEALLAAVGGTTWLPRESDLDAVTGVSGSGPAYVFYLIEALAAAAESEGLSPDVARMLARETVAGAGALAKETNRPPSELRRDVTSPAGTTAEGLKVLMDPDTGLGPLMERTVAAATRRSRELASA